MFLRFRFHRKTKILSLPLICYEFTHKLRRIEMLCNYLKYLLSYNNNANITMKKSGLFKTTREVVFSPCVNVFFRWLKRYFATEIPWSDGKSPSQNKPSTDVTDQAFGTKTNAPLIEIMNEIYCSSHKLFYVDCTFLLI